MARCGIFPVGKLDVSFPLTSAVCHYQVVDVQVVATLVQTYVSDAATAQEVIYVFPLPQDAAVCSFKAVIDGKRTIKGIVKEKKEAKQDYDQAVAQGKTAALLEKQHADIFQVSLGNLMPKQTIDIHISWVSVIAHDGAKPDSLRLMIPVTIAPRYGSPPPTSQPPKGATTIPVKSNLQVTISVQMTGNITSITSPTHPIAMTLGSASANAVETPDPTKGHVSLESEAFLEKDIVVVLASQKLDHPRCTIETDGQGSTDAYALTLVPRFDLPPLESQEYIFLVDRSGSMDGPRIAAVRTALQIMLRSLPTKNTSFNIWSFGSSYSSLWPSSKIYSADSVQEATAHIDQLEADYGGTEIGSALQAVFTSAKTHADVPRTAFVLTDGEAWDLQGVIDKVRDAAEKAKTEKSLLRTFVLGVGDDVSTPMCEGIARAGKGIAVFVGNNEKPEGKLMGLLKAARGAVIEDLSVDWGVVDGKAEADDDFEIVQQEGLATAEPKASTAPAAPINLFEETPSTTTDPPTSLGPEKVVVKLGPPPRIQQAPSTDKLPIPLYPGFRCSIFAIVRRTKDDPTPNTVKLTGQVLGRPVVLEVPVTRAASSPLQKIDNDLLTLHVLAARSLIQAIEDLPKSEVNEAKIVRLGTQYSLASSHTSFIAIDEEDNKVVGEDVKVREESYAPESPRGSSFPPPVVLHSHAAPPPMYPAMSVMPSPISLGRHAYAYAAAPTPPVIQASPGAPSTGAMYYGASADSIPTASTGRFGMDRIKEKVSSLGSMPARLMKRSKATPPPPPPVQPSASAIPTGYSAPTVVSAIADEIEVQLEYSAPSEEKSSSRPPPTIETLARNQSFEGYFPPSTLQTVLPKLPGQPGTLKALVGVDEGQKAKIWDTLLVVAYLTKVFANEKDAWSFLAEKGLEWVRGVLNEVAGAEKLLGEWENEASKAF